MPQLVPLDSTIKGLSEALVDRRVGSHLVITVPPDLVTGDDTLCIVIDILGAEPAEEDESEAEDKSTRWAGRGGEHSLFWTALEEAASGQLGSEHARSFAYHPLP